MIWPTPISCSSLLEDFRGGALGGSLMFMYHCAPYIPSQPVPSRGLEEKDSVGCCHVRMVSRTSWAQLTRAAGVCMTLWGHSSPVWTVLDSCYRRSNKSTLLRWACTENAGNIWKPDQIEFLLAALSGTLLPSTPQFSVSLVMCKWINVWLCAMCFCRALRIKLMEFNSIREPENSNWTEITKSN